MSVTTQGYVPKDINLKGSENVKITNLSILNQSNEVSHPLVNNLKQLMIRCRGNGVTRYSFILGDTSLNYGTIPRGCTLNMADLTFASKTIYLQCNIAPCTIEIVELF